MPRVTEAKVDNKQKCRYYGDLKSTRGIASHEVACQRQQKARENMVELEKRAVEGMFSIYDT